MLGLKGYYTNIPEKELSDQQIIERYHDLWQIEKSFRIAKSDLATRPIFHFNSDSVKSHILICFTGLMISRYLKLLCGHSIRRIKDALGEIKEVVLEDCLTGQVFNVKSRPSPDSEEIIELLKEKLP